MGSTFESVFFWKLFTINFEKKKNSIYMICIDNSRDSRSNNTTAREAKLLFDTRRHSIHYPSDPLVRPKGRNSLQIGTGKHR